MHNPAPATETPVTDRPRRAGLVLTAILVAAVVCNINVAAATVALPEIGESFDAPQTQLNLVGLGTGLGLAMSVLYSGAIADRYGRKQLLMLGLALTVGTSLMSALAPSIEFLVLARVCTGIAAGMAYPTTLSLITALWREGAARTGAIALWSGVSGMASVAGSIVAGVVLSVTTWNGVFLLSLPVAVVGFVLVRLFVPSHVDESNEPVDHLGGILSVVGIASFVLGVGIVFDPDATMPGSILLAVGLVVLTCFVLRQRATNAPLYDLGIARRRLFWVPAVAGTIAFGALIGAMFVGEQFMQNILGYTPLEAGAAVIPAAGGLLLMAPISARLVTASGTRPTMLAGYLLVFVAFATMLLWREGTPYPLIGFGFFAVGAGASFVMTASSHSLTGSTPVRKVGMASATSDLQSDLGGAIMQALLGAILAAGFSARFLELIHGSPQAGQVGAEVTRALQASYASAAHVAEQYPALADDILAAARDSLLTGAWAAYLVGAVAIVIGALIVWFGLPRKAQEEELRAGYHAEDA